MRATFRKALVLNSPGGQETIVENGRNPQMVELSDRDAWTLSSVLLAASRFFGAGVSAIAGAKALRCVAFELVLHISLKFPATTTLRARLWRQQTRPGKQRCLARS